MAEIIQDIGTPPRPVAEWFRLFAQDCRAARTLNPLERIRLKTRAGAFAEAADWLDKAHGRVRSPFPVMLEPGEHVSVDFQLYPQPDLPDPMQEGL